MHLMTFCSFPCLSETSPLTFHSFPCLSEASLSDRRCRFWLLWVVFGRGVTISLLCSYCPSIFLDRFITTQIKFLMNTSLVVFPKWYPWCLSSRREVGSFFYLVRGDKAHASTCRPSRRKGTAFSSHCWSVALFALPKHIETSLSRKRKWEYRSWAGHWVHLSNRGKRTHK